MKFSLSLIQAINDWQSSGLQGTKSKYAQILKSEAVSLEARLKSPQVVCYRRIDLSGGFLFDLGLKYELSEGISSWTKDPRVAFTFNDGLPPKGWQGVIYAVTPKAENVVIDISALMNDTDFIRAVEANKTKIKNYNFGIGRFGDSEKEVVIELESVPNDSLFAYGGLSSLVGGEFWICQSDAVSRITEKLIQFSEILKPYRKK